MSSTGRKSAQRSLSGMAYERQPDDFYATPAWCTRAIWPHLIAERSSDDGAPWYRFVNDPCCGDGAIFEALRGVADARTCFGGHELDAERAASTYAKGWQVTKRDALSPEPWFPRADLIITNPPFKLAMEFLVRALAEVAEGGTVAFLLRLAWLASSGRVAFHRAHPSDVFVLPRRPSFTGTGTDSADYAWFVYGPGRGGRWSILDVERPT